ncbi:MAG: PfkB family carbohydrate kinase, partial [Ruthenibacterium sp.]
MKYIIAAGIHTDEVHLPDGTIAVNQGGCGMYAMAGIRVFTTDVLPISGIEDDFLSLHKDWYSRNGITTVGLTQRLDFHARTVITYYSDGTRTDAPTVGIAKNRTRNALISEVEQFCKQEIAGLYTFRNFDSHYIEELIRLKTEYKFKFMWEIAADGAVPEYLDKIVEYSKNLDIFSINMDEAKKMFNTDNETEIKEFFMNNFKCWVFLRIGSRGAYMITPGICVYCPSVPNASVVDTTGG